MAKGKCQGQGSATSSKSGIRVTPGSANLILQATITFLTPFLKKSPLGIQELLSSGMSFN